MNYQRKHPNDLILGIDELSLLTHQEIDASQATLPSLVQSERLVEVLLRAMRVNAIMGNTQVVVLPSVSQLAEFAECSPFEVLKALLALTRKGYDYKCSGFSSPVMVCEPYAHLFEYPMKATLLQGA